MDTFLEPRTFPTISSWYLLWEPRIFSTKCHSHAHSRSSTVPFYSLMFTLLSTDSFKSRRSLDTKDLLLVSVMKLQSWWGPMIRSNVSINLWLNTYMQSSWQVRTFIDCIHQIPLLNSFIVCRTSSFMCELHQTQTTWLSPTGACQTRPQAKWQLPVETWTPGNKG